MTEEEQKSGGRADCRACRLEERRSGPSVCWASSSSLCVVARRRLLGSSLSSRGFCNAICHTPDGRLPAHPWGRARPGRHTDGGQRGRQRLRHDGRVHRAQNGTTSSVATCLALFRADRRGLSWITGSYEVLNTQTGQQVVPEKSLEDLRVACGIEPDHRSA